MRLLCCTNLSPKEVLRRNPNSTCSTCETELQARRQEMGLHFILGRAGTGKTHACLEAIRKEAQHDPEGKPLVLLVPEQATLVTSVSRLESFLACPFQHFADYGLRLKERTRFQVSAPELGLFYHAALSLFVGPPHRPAGPPAAERGSAQQPAAAVRPAGDAPDVAGSPRLPERPHLRRPLPTPVGGVALRGGGRRVWSVYVRWRCRDLLWPCTRPSVC